MGKFKYSLAWRFTRIGKQNKPGKVINTDDVLDVRGVLQQVEPLLFVQPIQEQNVKFSMLGQGD
ncbi:MAG TPA: hypothetical protein VKM55_22200 [Candidatus Lokiarchaeia archaeon]|nr:hypothetical protein [Candidatus Lokiarchaeia archaeon]